MQAAKSGYRTLQRIVKRRSGYLNSEILEILHEILSDSIRFLEDAQTTALQSEVPTKRYFSFGHGNNLSRPINETLFIRDVSATWAVLERLVRNFTVGSRDLPEGNRITSAVYTLSTAFAAGVDLTSTGDQQTPGTFFQYLVGYLFATALQINPSTQLPVLNLDQPDAKLPTDLIFDVGANQPKFHVPVKTSTRERAIQVWAHQRVLDGVYGTGRFIGTPVFLAETKLNTRQRIVTEICLPLQWRIYQMHMAQLTRIYYLDIPAAYRNLNDVFPRLHVRPFGEFFHEIDRLKSM